MPHVLWSMRTLEIIVRAMAGRYSQMGFIYKNLYQPSPDSWYVEIFIVVAGTLDGNVPNYFNSRAGYEVTFL